MVSRLLKLCQSGKISPKIICISETRFGEISPLRHNFKVFGYFQKLYLHSIWQTFKLTLAIFYAIGQIFNVVNSQT